MRKIKPLQNSIVRGATATRTSRFARRINSCAMSLVNFLILAIFGLAILLLGTQKVWAEEVAPNIVITEIMYDAAGPDDDNNQHHEWVEIYNLGDEIEITGWKFNDGQNHNLNIPEGQTDIWIGADEYLILADDRATFLNDYPDLEGRVIDTAMALHNTADKISLIDEQGKTVDELTYSNAWGANGNGRTLEKIDFEAANDRINWQESYVLGGTPGEKSSEFEMPDYPIEVLELVDVENGLIKSVKVSSVIDGDTIKVSGLSGLSSDVRFLAVDSAETGESLFEPAKDFTASLVGKTVDLIISRVEDEQKDRYGRTLAVVIYNDKVFNTQLLERGLASYYDTDNLVLKNAAWEAIEEQAQSERIGFWASLDGSSVILSELLPNPVGSDESEWIEIYNPLGRRVNLSYFLLDGYLIPYGTIIPAKSWLIFPRSQTGITLNNSGDTVKLFFPDGILADEVIYSKVSEGIAWAISGGVWKETTKLTPGAANIISPPVVEKEDDEENVEESINTEPIEIKTGEAQNYENKLVKIIGTVISTSGNTFWLDDGSGEIKVYIQAARDIDKPEMHKGDIFEIIGIVNFYRGVWRILPQRQEDIKLIKAKEEAAEEAPKAKTTTAKTSTASKAKSSTTTAKARAPTTKKVASSQTMAAEDALQNTQIGGYKSPLWLELIKVMTGLSVILLLILGVKLWRLKRDNPRIDGRFGDDFT